MGKRNIFDGLFGMVQGANDFFGCDPIANFYFYKIRSLAMTRFKWLNIPKEDSNVDERFLEAVLFDKGAAVWSYDEVIGGYTGLWTTLGSNLDIYNLPQRFTAYGSNGYTREVTSDNAVIIFDNNQLIPGCFGAFYYAKRLADIERSIMSNLIAVRNPIIVQVSASQKLAVQNAVKKVMDNDPVVVVSDDYDLSNTIKSLDTSAKLIVPELQSAKQSVWSECMLFLGFDNRINEKKERLITDEVESNNGQLDGYRFAGYQMRSMACEKINEMFGLKISVEWRSADKVESRLIGDVDIMNGGVEGELV